MRIGLDFDNTLADYDALFAALAVEQGVLDALPRGGKREVRDLVRATAGELAWRRLQAHAYGPHMSGARIMAGADKFLTTCKKLGLEVCIVSHKSRRAADESVTDDLREAAMDWMRAQGFFARFGLSDTRVHFEDTREAKVRRIASLGCAAFVDDLEEVFLTPGFPSGVRRILFDPAGHARGPFETCSTWEEIADACLRDSGAYVSAH